MNPKRFAKDDSFPVAMGKVLFTRDVWTYSGRPGSASAETLERSERLDLGKSTPPAVSDGSRLKRFSLILIPLLATVGCAPKIDAVESLVVVTNWSKSDRDIITREFNGAFPSVRVRWITVDFGPDSARLANEIPGAEVFLGGSSSSRRSGQGKGIERRIDPRRDLFALADFKDLVREVGWERAFGECVDSLAHERTEEAKSAGAGSRRCVAVALQTPIGSSAARFLRTVRESRSVVMYNFGTDKDLIDSWIADLIGSSSIDADEEARAARAAIERAGRPVRWVKRFESAPFWPPASVLKLKRKGAGAGETPRVWLEALADQIAPDPSARVWLLESWRKPERPIDDAFLRELTRAADGRVAAEPRFREWLRAEWTASARQRFAWIARHAGADF